MVHTFVSGAAVLPQCGRAALDRALAHDHQRWCEPIARRKDGCFLLFFASSADPGTQIGREVLCALPTLGSLMVLEASLEALVLTQCRRSERRPSLGVTYSERLHECIARKAVTTLNFESLHRTCSSRNSSRTLIRVKRSGKRVQHSPRIGSVIARG